jgi:hypothetical protein
MKMILEQKRKCKKCGEIKSLSLFVNARMCKFGPYGLWTIFQRAQE